MAYRESFYRYLMTQKDPDSNSEIAQFANNAQHDLAFPKQEQDYDKLSNLSYTQRLAQEWINVIQNGYTDSKGEKHKGYGTENQPYWASVKKAKKYNQIYE